jgi:hypothetical protein
MYGKAKIPTELWGLIVSGLLLIFLWSPDNFFLTVPVLLYIPFIYRLFFVKQNTNVLFWGLMLQWLAVSTQVIYCSILNIPLNELFKNTVFPADLMEYTNYLSITGIYVFSLGLFMAVRKVRVSVSEAIWDRYDARKIFQVYVVVSLLINASQFAIWAFPNFVQYFFFFFYIKWGFFLVAFIAVFKRAPDMKIFLFAFLGFEFVLGLSSYFASNFINILLFTLIAYSAIKKKISTRQALSFVIMGALTFHIAVLWTASKKDYRAFLNEGSRTQAVKVSKEAARKKLLQLVVRIDARTYRLAIEDMVNRVGYIQYFAAAIRFVPARVPHEGGKVYLAAVSHFLIPRFLDPDKPILDDSKHTNKYTGLGVSGRAQGTSFSLGSFADAYIDFGPVKMFIPIFCFGWLIGTFFKILYRPDIWGIILTGPFFLLINIYGADTTKALGFVLIYFLVIFFVNRILIQFIEPFMKLYRKE